MRPQISSSLLILYLLIAASGGHEMAGQEPQVMPQIDGLFILYMYIMIAASGGHDAAHER